MATTIMAALILREYLERRILRRNRIFRDRTNPFDVYDDVELFNKFRFRRQDIIELTDSVSEDLELCNRRGSLTPLLQVLLALHFYASGSFQDRCSEMIGVNQSTSSRTISRVTDALLRHVPTWVKLPAQREADVSKEKFYNLYSFPNVIGCIDGTQIRIQAPSEFEHEFVNQKNFHSINVQLICDADLMFTNCIAKRPGSVHEAQILRESQLFKAFESTTRKPLTGHFLGDSRYMLLDWLLTPVLNPTTAKERSYNLHHRSARSSVQRAIRVLRQRWRCLRRLRLQPAKACKVITVCVMLHNRARSLKLAEPSDSESNSELGDYTDDEEQCPDNGHLLDRTQTAAGNSARDRLIENFF